MPWRGPVVTALVAALGLVLGLAWLTGHTHPGSVVLSAVLVFGVSALLVQRADADSWPARVSGAVVASAIVLLVFGLHALAGWLGASAVGADLAATPLPVLLACCFIIGLGAVTVMHHLALHRALPPRWQAWRVHLANGLYLGALTRGRVR